MEDFKTALLEILKQEELSKKYEQRLEKIELFVEQLKMLTRNKNEDSGVFRCFFFFFPLDAIVNTIAEVIICQKRR